MNLSKRPRILRKSASIRNWLSENRVTLQDLVTPLFVCEGKNIEDTIPSMPGYFCYSEELLLKKIEEYIELGLRWFLIFPKIEEGKKDNIGTEALNEKGLIPRVIKKIKSLFPDICIISDIALDPYSSFGHDGIVEKGEILNDETVEILTKMSLLHAHCGIDFVSPSDMMDGRVKAIRDIFEKNRYNNTGIISYSAKYASAFYGPFRDALDSKPGFGDKKTYQMDCANAKEALKEIELDIEEGADIVMIKPGMPYLDIVQTVSEKTSVPVMVYQVSGEYAMLKSRIFKQMA